MKLNNDFLEPYKTTAPDWGPVGYVTYKRTYSRDSEEWWQTCQRVVEGTYTWQKRHCVGEANRPWSDEKAQHSMQQMYRLMFDMKFLPPGRGLFTMGVPGLLEKAGAAANNCGMVSTADDPFDAFCWAMDHLMLGVGVGFDTLGADTRIYSPDYTQDGTDHTVGDSRQGWVHALARLLQTYMTRGKPPVYFDYSRVRPKGSPVGFGGTASGPEPLQEMLEDIRDLLDKAAKYGGKLTSTDIVDIMNLIGRCIVSGNIRRSAEIAFGSPDDRGFLTMKNKYLHPKENAHHRWAANHSVVCKVGQNYEEIAETMFGVDELGIMWLDNARDYGRTSEPRNYLDHRAVGANPCAEQTLEHKELCCLVEVFPSRCENYYEFQQVLKYAYLYAKTVTLVPVHDSATQRVVNRNRRIGCSLTGIQQAKQRHGDFLDWCTRGYSYLRSLDDRYSTWFEIPRSIKLTSVKPSGTISKLPGVTAGIHFPPAEHYWQVIRFASDSPILDRLVAAGYTAYDLAPGEPNTHAVYFPVSEVWFSRADSDVSMWEQALQAVELQRYWADNQVSITVKLGQGELPDVPRLLRLVERDLKAISFFPRSEHTFDHAPWQPTTKEELDEYRKNLKPVDLSASVHEVTDQFCSGETCELPQQGDE